MNRLLFMLALLAGLGAGLIAGVFFAFSAFVMAALGRLPPPAGISAMQSINVAVLNPMFFAAFFGTAAGCVLLTVAASVGWVESGVAWLVAGSALYLVGTLFVTIAFNVPLNNRLAAIEPDSAEGAGVWAHYLSAWTAWNHVRTAAALAAAASFIMALR